MSADQNFASQSRNVFRANVGFAGACLVAMLAGTPSVAAGIVIGIIAMNCVAIRLSPRE